MFSLIEQTTKAKYKANELRRWFKKKTTLWSEPANLKKCVVCFPIVLGEHHSGQGVTEKLHLFC